MLRPLFALLLLAATTFAAEPNTLTAEEKAAGWQLLFDGKTLEGWQPLKRGAEHGWKVEEGELRLYPSANPKQHSDLITAKNYQNFELTFDWVIAEKGNSGLKYNLPDPTKNVGCEYQLLDDNGHPDATKHNNTRKTGGLYDVIAPAADKKLNPPGEWNSSRIVIKAGKVEHYLNGGKTVEFTLGSPELAKFIAESKFAKTKGWGVAKASPILLQDHGDKVRFRNVKLRRAE